MIARIFDLDLVNAFIVSASITAFVAAVVVACVFAFGSAYMAESKKERK